MTTKRFLVTAWTAAVAFALLAGCLSPQQQQWTCERSKAVFAAYQAAEQAGAVTDPDVIAGARVAAAFLSSYCGWLNPKARGLSGAPVTDRNGVLVVHPPITETSQPN